METGGNGSVVLGAGTGCSPARRVEPVVPTRARLPDLEAEPAPDLAVVRMDCRVVGLKVPDAQ